MREHNNQQESFLERYYGYRLNIHPRDFTPGRPILSNIEEAITGSRRLIVLLSMLANFLFNIKKNSLSLIWCNMTRIKYLLPFLPEYMN